MEIDAYGYPTDESELLWRIAEAKTTQRRRDPYAELYDPIEDNPRIRPIIREVERRAKKESLVRGPGRRSDVWARMEQILKNDTEQGRKLGFVAQEMGREINTIGSKASDFEIQHRVVMAKEWLEKIKEQSANLL